MFDYSEPESEYIEPRKKKTVRPKENYKKWLLEGATYRLGDLGIGFGIGLCITLFVTHDWGDSIEVASGIALLENALNTIFYFINRWLWSRKDMVMDSMSETNGERKNIGGGK